MITHLLLIRGSWDFGLADSDVMFSLYANESGFTIRIILPSACLTSKGLLCPYLVPALMFIHIIKCDVTGIYANMDTEQL